MTRRLALVAVLSPLLACLPALPGDSARQPSSGGGVGVVTVDEAGGQQLLEACEPKKAELASAAQAADAPPTMSIAGRWRCSYDNAPPEAWVVSQSERNVSIAITTATDSWAIRGTASGDHLYLAEQTMALRVNDTGMSGEVFEVSVRGCEAHKVVCSR